MQYLVSEIGKILEYPEENFIQIYPDDNDAITGVFDNGDSLYIYKEHSHRVIYTGNASIVNWQIDTISKNIGASIICQNSKEYFTMFEGKPYINNAYIGEVFQTDFLRHNECLFN